MSKRVLVVDDDQGALYAIKRVLSQKGFSVYTLPSSEGMEDYLESCHVLIMDIKLHQKSGVDVVEVLRKKGINIPVIFITAYTDAEEIVRAMKLGAVDVLKKPFGSEDIHKAVLKALDSETSIKSSYEEKYNVIGVSKAMFEVFKQVGLASTNNLNVLITGETGVGKELIAKLIHINSGRKGAFVHVNCPSIPWDLFEAELFGYVKGAFTGAVSDRKGKAELAQGGTLFMDEIGDLPYKLQAKLLSFVEKRSFYPVGANREVSVDVRLVFATNRNLKALVEEGKFREDLYHRISQVEIYIPPLRERKEDIKPLIEHFISMANEELGLNITGIGEQALRKAMDYSWPGNVRELKNVVYKAVLSTKAGAITDLPIREEGIAIEEYSLSKFVELYLSSKKEEELSTVLEELEHMVIKKLLERYGGNKSKVAQLLGISRNTLSVKLRE
ncbi:MAG: sigma-54-dependent Fis family transcriptional regulator [Aquificota bacterium]|nr:MAG: sigma-54-dependent Fis family transcriptional regulator [Aquificota bacterium]